MSTLVNLGNTSTPSEPEVAIELTAHSEIEHFFTAADAFFQLNVKNGLVDYKSIHSSPDKIEKLTEMIANIDLSKSSNGAKTAFYINAYNLLTIKNVVDNWPMASPLDNAGFFNKVTFMVAGDKMTLNDIENNHLRPDPRVHFVLVCGANGCPKIINNAYTPGNLQLMLDKQTKKAMNDPQFIRVSSNEKKVEISEIFKWYSDDFVKHSGSVTAYINAYRDTPLPSKAEVGYYTYDWKVNAK